MGDSKNKIISGGASILLDTLRLVAALTVLFTHANDQWFTPIFERMNTISHAAVVVFFVLSGYVIAFTTASNNRGPRQYAVARLSRLYSVVLPAIVLTAVVELIVRRADANLAEFYTRGNDWPRYAICALFCNEIGFFSAAPPINVALWSLSFEFWYYIIFGLWFYRSHTWKSRLLLVGACLIAGPKILILLPVWLLGVLAYQLRAPVLSAGRAWVAVLLLLAAAGLVIVLLPAMPFILGFKPLFFANQFLTDWIIGILFAAAIWLLPTNSSALKISWAKPLRKIADWSFPLYVLHYPLLVLWQATFGWQAGNLKQMWLAMFFVSLVSVVLGIFLERGRRQWTSFFNWLFALPPRLFLVLQTRKATAARRG